MAELATVRIFRFDPAVDKEPRFDIYEGVAYQDRSVLEVIESIYEERDSSLAFRHACTNGSCGGCVVVMNGKPVLSCQEPAQAEMTIEPHRRYEVIRDLAVDFNRPKLRKVK